jgi:cbb3-type cytochrome oxidase subunit 3
VEQVQINKKIYPITKNKKSMFRQFIDQSLGADVYLITSLGIFLVFFLVVTIMLFTMNKKHINYMSELPLTDEKV